MENKKRIVFVNLHSDWMLVKAASVYVFKFSAAIKHKYLMDYLLTHPEYEMIEAFLGLEMIMKD